MIQYLKRRVSKSPSKEAVEVSLGKLIVTMPMPSRERLDAEWDAYIQKLVGADK